MTISFLIFIQTPLTFAACIGKAEVSAKRSRFDIILTMQRLSASPSSMGGVMGMPTILPSERIVRTSVLTKECGRLSITYDAFRFQDGFF